MLLRWPENEKNSSLLLNRRFRRMNPCRAGAASLAADCTSGGGDRRRCQTEEFFENPNLHVPSSRRWLGLWPDPEIWRREIHFRDWRTGEKRKTQRWWIWVGKNEQRDAEFFVGSRVRELKQRKKSEVFYKCGVLAVC